MATTTPVGNGMDRDPISPVIQKLVAAAGIVFAVLLVASIAAGGGETPDFDAPVSEWTGYAQDSGNDQRLGLLLFAFAAYEFVLFLASLRSRLGRAEDAARGFTRGGYAVLVGGTIGILGLLIGLGVSTAATAHPDTSPDVIRAINDVSGAGFVLAAPGFAAMFITTFLIAKPTRALPSWLCWLALVTGICFLLQLLVLLSDEFDNAFGIFYPLGFLGLAIFAIGASVEFLRGVGARAAADEASPVVR